MTDQEHEQAQARAVRFNWPEPQPEPETSDVQSGSIAQEAVAALLEQLAVRMPRVASVVCVEAEELTVAVKGQYAPSASECSEEEEDFDPYSDDTDDLLGAVSYGYSLRAKDFRVLEVACPSDESSLESTGLNVSAAALFLNDTVANKCLLETAQMEDVVSAPGTARAALLYEQLSDGNRATVSVVESSGLRFRPRWGARPADGAVIPLDLIDQLQPHLTTFFGFSGDESEDEEDNNNGGEEGTKTQSQLLVRVEGLSVVLSAPPVVSSSSSGLLLYVDFGLLDRAATHDGTLPEIAVEVQGTRLLLTDDHRRGKGDGPPSQANLTRYSATYREVVTVPVLSAISQSNANTGQLEALTCGALSLDGFENPAAPSVLVSTCGDSFHTLKHLFQEVLEARTTVLDSRKTPSDKPGAVSHAVFADSQAAMVGLAEEPTAYEESTEVVQMEAVTWGSAPVIREEYIGETLEGAASCAAASGGGGAVGELQRSGSTTSDGFVDLIEEELMLSVGHAARPASRELASAEEAAMGSLPDVPDSDQDTELFEPGVLGNLMESYMFDAELDAELELVASAGPTPARLGTPPGIGGGSLRSDADSTLPVPAAVARMLPSTAYPPATATVDGSIRMVTWKIHGGSDWPAEKATCENERDPLHVEAQLTDLRVQHLLFPVPPDGDVEWHLKFTLRDIKAIDCVERSRFQGQAALAVDEVPNRQRETHATAITLAMDSIRAIRKEVGIDIQSLWKLKLHLAPLRLYIDGGMLRRLAKFFHDVMPRPPPPSRPDDPRFQLAEVAICIKNDEICIKNDRF